MADLLQSMDVKRQPMLPLDPECTPKVMWDMLLMIFIVVSVVVIPYRIGTGLVVTFACHPASKSLDYATDVFFFFDILLNFVTAYKTHDEMLQQNVLVRDKRKIAWRYFTG